MVRTFIYSMNGLIGVIFSLYRQYFRRFTSVTQSKIKDDSESLNISDVLSDIQSIESDNSMKTNLI